MQERKKCGYYKLISLMYGIKLLYKKVNLYMNEIESYTFLHWKINYAHHLKTSCEFSMIMHKKETGRKKFREIVFFANIYRNKE